MLEVLTILLVLLIFSLISFQKKLLNLKGIIFADLVGLITYYSGGLIAFFTIVFFYLIAEFATKLSRTNKKKHEQRTTSNILGNAGAAIIALLLGQFIPFFGAIAAALADTVSSEIGMLSTKKPRLITNFSKVESGTDGGITFLGIITGAIASILIAIIYFLFIENSLKIAGIIAFAGVCGTLIDSLLGAIFERKGKLSNTQVNFIASSSGAIITFILIALL